MIETLIEPFKVRFDKVFEMSERESLLYLSDNHLLFYLTDAEKRMDKRVWGSLYEQGLMYLTAHLLFLAGFHEHSPNSGKYAADSNTLYNSDSVGDVSTNANFTGTEKDWFKTSAFGEQYLSLENRINNYALAVGMDW
ncbi:MAG: DUF4054 domain-containing protein [Candidatus Phlomobacter fragariae]